MVEEISEEDRFMTVLAFKDFCVIVSLYVLNSLD